MGNAQEPGPVLIESELFRLLSTPGVASVSFVNSTERPGKDLSVEARGLGGDPWNQVQLRLDADNPRLAVQQALHALGQQDWTGDGEDAKLRAAHEAEILGKLGRGLAPSSATEAP